MSEVIKNFWYFNDSEKNNECVFNTQRDSIDFVKKIYPRCYIKGLFGRISFWVKDTVVGECIICDNGEWKLRYKI